MAIGAVGSEIPLVRPETALEPAGATAVAKAEAFVAPEPPQQKLPAIIARDAFTPVDDAAGMPDLGNPDAVAGALTDLSDARHDLRVARRHSGPEARADRREARAEIEAAKAELDAALAGGEAVAADPAVVTPPEIDDAPPQDNGLALGKTLPNISQLKPNGLAHGYTNGEMNCAPTSMAMIARGLPPDTLLDGKPIGQMPDAELINRLGRIGDTDEQGTSANGVIAMAEELGLSTSTRQGGLDMEYYDSVLAAGGSVIANGAYPDEHGEAVGHFVTVTAKTNDGNYVVNDPRFGESFVVTPRQLDEFLRSNTVHGGISIGVGG
jgi:hypothetical protein